MASNEAKAVEQTLQVFVSIDDEDLMEGGQKGFLWRDREASIREIPVDVLRRSLRRTVGGLRELFDDIAESDGALPLKEASVSFEITATGGVAVLGTSAEMAGSGAITLTFGK